MKMPGSEITFDNLKSLKKFIAGLNKMLPSKNFKDYKEMFSEYDK